MVCILIASPDDAERGRFADFLRADGYEIRQAVDGGTAMKVVDEHKIDLAIFEQNMLPRNGFDFARHVTGHNLDIGLILISDDGSTDLLLEASRHEITQLVRKPVDITRLGEIVRRVLRAHGRPVAPPSAVGLGPAAPYQPEDLMRRALALAAQNARSRMGGPFGAVVADAAGYIVGEGVNSVSALCDPAAHAEVLAIRRAAERLGRTDLRGCTLYCSSAPTMLAQALILGTGLSRVHYGLSHEEVGATRLDEAGILGQMAKPLHERTPPYIQMQHAEALALFRDWQAQPRKVAD